MEEASPNALDILQNPQFRITPGQQMVAACTGGVVTSLLMTPFDVVKIRMQAQQESVTVGRKCFLYCNGLMDHLCPCVNPNGSSPYSTWYARPSNFNGTLDAFAKISRTEGLLSLWSGLSPTLVLALPATVVYFVTYEQLRCRLKDWSDQKGANAGHQPFWVPLTAGCTARIWAVTLVSPLELIRTKMQSKRLKYAEMREGLKSLLHYHGIPGLWKGLIPTLLRDVPFSGIYWVTYEKIKSQTNKNGSSFFYSFLGGSISGAIATVLTNPFDVVKTLYQIQFIDKEIMTEPPGRSDTVLKTLEKVYRKNGLSGLFAGLTPRLAKVVPACAIMVASFEYGKNYFRRENARTYAQRRQNCRF